MSHSPVSRYPVNNNALGHMNHIPVSRHPVNNTSYDHSHRHGNTSSHRPGMHSNSYYSHRDLPLESPDHRSRPNLHTASKSNATHHQAVVPDHRQIQRAISQRSTSQRNTYTCTQSYKPRSDSNSYETTPKSVRHSRSQSSRMNMAENRGQRDIRHFFTSNSNPNTQPRPSSSTPLRRVPTSTVSVNPENSQTAQIDDGTVRPRSVSLLNITIVNDDKTFKVPKSVPPITGAAAEARRHPANTVLSGPVTPRQPSVFDPYNYNSPLYITLPLIAPRTYPWNLTRVLNQFTYPETDEMFEKFLIIGDSMISSIDDITDTLILSYPGITVAELTALVQYFKIPEITIAKWIILNVGTNDIANGDHVDLIMNDFEHLVRALRDINPFLQLCIATILPRPIDNETTGQEVSRLNYSLMLNSAHLGYIVSNIYQFYHHQTRPIRIFFNRGGLHLRTQGISRLQQLLTETVRELAVRAGQRFSPIVTHTTQIRRRKSSKQMKYDMVNPVFRRELTYQERHGIDAIWPEMPPHRTVYCQSDDDQAEQLPVIINIPANPTLNTITLQTVPQDGGSDLPASDSSNVHLDPPMIMEGNKEDIDQVENPMDKRLQEKNNDDTNDVCNKIDQFMVDTSNTNESTEEATDTNNEMAISDQEVEDVVQEPVGENPRNPPQDPIPGSPSAPTNNLIELHRVENMDII